jgi:hypothetical protein
MYPKLKEIVSQFLKTPKTDKAALTELMKKANNLAKNCDDAADAFVASLVCIKISEDVVK